MSYNIMPQEVKNMLDLRYYDAASPGFDPLANQTNGTYLNLDQLFHKSQFAEHLVDIVNRSAGLVTKHAKLSGPTRWCRIVWHIREGRNAALGGYIEAITPEGKLTSLGVDDAQLSRGTHYGLLAPFCDKPLPAVISDTVKALAMSILKYRASRHREHVICITDLPVHPRGIQQTAAEVMNRALAVVKCYAKNVRLCFPNASFAEVVRLIKPGGMFDDRAIRADTFAAAVKETTTVAGLADKLSVSTLYATWLACRAGWSPKTGDEYGCMFGGFGVRTGHDESVEYNVPSEVRQSRRLSVKMAVVNIRSGQSSAKVKINNRTSYCSLHNNGEDIMLHCCARQESEARAVLGNQKLLMGGMHETVNTTEAAYHTTNASTEQDVAVTHSGALARWAKMLVKARSNESDYEVRRKLRQIERGLRSCIATVNARSSEPPRNDNPPRSITAGEQGTHTATVNAKIDSKQVRSASEKQLRPGYGHSMKLLSTVNVFQGTPGWDTRDIAPTVGYIRPATARALPTVTTKRRTPVAREHKSAQATFSTLKTFAKSTKLDAADYSEGTETDTVIEAKLNTLGGQEIRGAAILCSQGVFFKDRHVSTAISVLCRNRNVVNLVSRMRACNHSLRTMLALNLRQFDKWKARAVEDLIMHACPDAEAVSRMAVARAYAKIIKMLKARNFEENEVQVMSGYPVIITTYGREELAYKIMMAAATLKYEKSAIIDLFDQATTTDMITREGKNMYLTTVRGVNKHYEAHITSAALQIGAGEAMIDYAMGCRMLLVSPLKVLTTAIGEATGECNSVHFDSLQQIQQTFSAVGVGMQTVMISAEGLQTMPQAAAVRALEGGDFDTAVSYQWVSTVKKERKYGKKDSGGASGDVIETGLATYDEYMMDGEPGGGHYTEYDAAYFEY